jgi:hypothetical protein
MIKKVINERDRVSSLEKKVVTKHNILFDVLQDTHVLRVRSTELNTSLTRLKEMMRIELLASHIELLTCIGNSVFVGMCILVSLIYISCFMSYYFRLVISSFITQCFSCIFFITFIFQSGGSKNCCK